MRPRRAVTLALLACVLGGSLLVPAGAAEPRTVTRDFLRAYSIAPPGQEGDVTADELVTEDYGPHYDDQLELYASLVEDDDITEEELADYFHDMSFGPFAIESQYSPQTGVSVIRDEWGIPHITATSMEKASFGLGYVTAEDRMWQMDVLRHAARGTLSEFIGPGEDNQYFRMDVVTRREGYTEEEITKMFESFDEKFGAEGEVLQEGLEQYAAGVNAHIEELKTTRIDERPAEYEATGNPYPEHPHEWTPEDTLFLVVLQLRAFGETAGFELENAALYRHLRERLGNNLGRRVYDDFLAQSEPSTYTSIERDEAVFHSQNLGPVDPRSIAIPDNAEEVAEDAARERALVSGVLESFGFKTPASNALLVEDEESATNNPLQIGAPQVGYAVPGFFMEVDVHAPGVDFRGPAVPGASALIPLGRGSDYAWSLTTGFSDAVDVRAEKLCNPNGGEVRRHSNHYLFNGECREMRSRTETFIVKPIPSEPAPPRIEERTFYRTVHGPVFKRGTVDGEPVAFVKERFFWKKELDSVPQFYHWNTQVDTLADFREAARKFTMSFNAFYADSEHIAHFHVGHYPRRARGVHPSLPTWGTGQWEWQGRLPFKRHPKVIDPEQGWVANWNNKPAAGWDHMDLPKWGSIHRVQLLARQMRALLDGPGKAQLSDLVDVIREAATQDSRAFFLGPRMVRRIESSTGLAQRERDAAELVDDWVSTGAHRKNDDRDEDTDAGPAVAIFDAWYDKLIHAVFDDELGEEGYGLVSAPVFDQDMLFDYSSYLKLTFDHRTRDRLARNYCDNTGTEARETCRSVIVSALTQALDQLEEEQGDDMSQWAAPAWWIQFTPRLGAGSVPDIPWQNRGTHNHVVEILRDASD